MSRFLTFLAGMLTTLVLLAAIAWLSAKHVAAWTVVSEEPAKADAIIVLGGGDGSRLRKGLQLYEQGFASRLILVDTHKNAWTHVVRKLCTDCVLEGKNVAILDGSVSTHTDAELSLQHCRQNGLQSVLVVTSPYHTRRAQLTFADIYGPAGIDTAVVSSGDYAKYLPPAENWWRDQRTLEFVWLELGKIVYWEFFGER